MNTVPSKNSRRRVTKRFMEKIMAINSDVFCVYCEDKLVKMQKHRHRRNGLTIDHFVPVTKGGANNSENLFPCCRRCNMQKGDMNPLTDIKFWVEFLPSKLNIYLV
jgi:5-methylcytosine-specific restriction endonuclease McrA